VVTKRQALLEAYLAQLLSLAQAAQTETFVGFLENSASFAELRRNLKLQVDDLARNLQPSPASSSDLVRPLIVVVQMLSLQAKTDEAAKGANILSAQSSFDFATLVACLQLTSACSC
jgi:hypothetical protein